MDIVPWRFLLTISVFLSTARASDFRPAWEATLHPDGHVTVDRNLFEGAGDLGRRFPLSVVMLTRSAPLPQDDTPHAVRSAAGLFASGASFLMWVDDSGRAHPQATGPIASMAVCPLPLDDGRVSILSFGDDSAGWNDTSRMQQIRVSDIATPGGSRVLHGESVDDDRLPRAASNLVDAWTVNRNGTIGVMQTRNAAFIIDIAGSRVAAVYPMPKSPAGAHLGVHVTFAAGNDSTLAISFSLLGDDADRGGVVVVGAVEGGAFTETLQLYRPEGVGVHRLSRSGRSLYLGDKLGTTEWDVERFDVESGRLIDSFPGRIVSADDRRGTMALSIGESTVAVCDLSDGGLSILYEVEFPGVRLTSPTVVVAPSGRFVVDRTGGETVLVDGAGERSRLDAGFVWFIRGEQGEDYVLQGGELPAAGEATVRISRCGGA